MVKIKATIEGTSPLLMNRFLDRQITDKAKKKTGEMKEIMAEDKLYLLDDKPYVPSRYIVASLIDAAKQFQIPGKKKSTYSKYIGATVRVEPEALILKPNKWEPFSISAVNPMTKGRMMVTRPMFKEWSVEFNIVCEDENIGIETMQNITEQAGKFTGIGDWRPEKKGPFGRFRIVKFEIIKDK